MAAASILSDLVVGLERTEVDALIANFREVMRSRGKIQADEEILGDAAALSGVSKFPARVKCALLAWIAAADAMNQTRLVFSAGGVERAGGAPRCYLYRQAGYVFRDCAPLTILAGRSSE